MLKSFAFLAFLFFATFTQAQTVATKDAQGNYTQSTVKPSAESLTKNATKSAATFTDKDGLRYDVYLSASGKTFILRTSKKSGNLYRSYFATVGE